jgi:hypothetical protein
MLTRKLFVLILILGLLAPTAAAAPLAGPCVPGAVYDSACDANQDGSITVTDIQLAAGHWNQTGAFVSDNNHTHLGQTWTGSNNPLKIQGPFGAPDYAGLVLSNSSSTGIGLRVTYSGMEGIYVDAAGTVGLAVASAVDGVYIRRAGNPSTFTPSSLSNGFEVAGAQGNGLHVGRADNDGVAVNAAGQDGVYVGTAGSPSGSLANPAPDGFEIAGAQGNGLYVGRADNDGVAVNNSGQDGVYVGAAGNPSSVGPSTAANGFEVAGAQGNGLHVGRADNDGVYVDAAGGDGVFICRTGSASPCSGDAGSSGIEIGNAQDYGLHLQRSGFSGLVVTQAGSSALFVVHAGNYGVYVGDAEADGVHVYAAYDGVYANTEQTTHEWGFDTPDKIYAGTALASNGPLMLVAQSGDRDRLETGDLVVVSGTGAVLGESESPPPLVRRAAAGDGSLMGVVYRRFVAEEKVEEAEGDGQEERRTYLRTRSTDGPVASGDTLLVVVLGPMQVKAAPGEGAITAGMRLTAAAGGGVRPLQTRTVEGMVVSEGAPVIGTAMGPAQDGLVWVLVNPQ